MIWEGSRASVVVWLAALCWRKPFKVATWRVGDTVKNNQIMMVGHWKEGFKATKNVARSTCFGRNRHFDMFEILKNRPDILGNWH